MKRKKEISKRARLFHLQKLFSKWLIVNYRLKEKRIVLSYGDDLRNEALIKLAFEGLVKYKEKRQTIYTLKSIGNEMALIREQTYLHKVIANWY